MKSTATKKTSKTFYVHCWRYSRVLCRSKTSWKWRRGYLWLLNSNGNNIKSIIHAGTSIKKEFSSETEIYEMKRKKKFPSSSFCFYRQNLKRKRRKVCWLLYDGFYGAGWKVELLSDRLMNILRDMDFCCLHKFLPSIQSVPLWSLAIIKIFLRLSNASKRFLIFYENSLLKWWFKVI